PRWFSVHSAAWLAVLAVLTTAPDLAFAQGMSQQARQQIQSLLEEKESRTPAQRKIDSNLLYAIKQSRGQAVAAVVPRLRTGVDVDAGASSAPEVDITARVIDALLAMLANFGAQVIDVHREAHSI